MNQDERRAALGDAWTDTGLVVTTSVGTPMSARNLTRSWSKLLVRAGVERRGFHTLRRTYPTLLASRGVHPKAAQRLLGHSSPSLTLIAFTAVSAEMLREAAEAVDPDFGSQ